MTDERSNEGNSYYNEFVDNRDCLPMKSRQKFNNNNAEKIKIANRRLPPDFFRPTHVTLNLRLGQDREEGLKTPCFGQEKKQSYSVTLIPKQKKLATQYSQRMETMPVQPTESRQKYEKRPRQSQTREKSNKGDQLSSRQKSYQRSRESRDHNSQVQRQKIRFHPKLIITNNILQEKNEFLEKNLPIKLNFHNFNEPKKQKNKPKSHRLPPIL